MRETSVDLKPPGTSRGARHVLCDYPSPADLGESGEEAPASPAASSVTFSPSSSTGTLQVWQLLFSFRFFPTEPPPFSFGVVLRNSVVKLTGDERLHDLLSSGFLCFSFFYASSAMINVSD